MGPADYSVMGFGTSVDVVSAFIVTFCLPYLLKTPGANLGAKVGYIMGGDAILSLIFAVFFVPEIAVSTRFARVDRVRQLIRSGPLARGDG